MIESVSACGWSCTADSTATRGRVTRSATLRNMRSKSDVVGTVRKPGSFSGINQVAGCRLYRIKLGPGSLELVQQRVAEGGQVSRGARGDEVAVHDHLLVHPVRP